MPSYSPVFSVPLIQYGPETPNTQFLVPDGYTAVVRQISGVQNIGGFILWLAIADSEDAPNIIVYGAGQVGDFNTVQQEGRWVAPAGSLITLYFSETGSAFYAYAGGYLLRNAAT